MAAGSKSRKGTENSEIPESDGKSNAKSVEPGEPVDSSTDNPVVIEGEAIEASAEGELQPAGTQADEQPERHAVDTTAPTAGVAPPPAEPSGPGFLALVFGGILAGAIGYGASFLSPPPRPVVDPGLAASVDAAGERIDVLAGDVAALKAAPAAVPDLSAIEERLEDLAVRVDAFETRLAELAAAAEETNAALDAETGDLSRRIAALETADPSGVPATSEDQIAAFRERLETLTADAEARLNAATDRAAELEAAAAARAEELQANAEAAAAAAEVEAARIEAEAKREAALADVKAALETGTAFAPALEQLADAPADLSAVAEEGVPTLAELQRAFPDAARAAVHAAAAAPEDASAGERFTAFLKRHTTARSLTPREGSDTDAVLSRAEAALGEGDLGTALAELESLPDPAKAVMQDWIDRARIRATALDAVGGLTATN